MHLNEVLAWIDSHPGLPMVHGGKYKPKTIKVNISDSAKASAGGGAGSAAPGIRARRSDGGGGGQMSPQESKPPEVEKKQSQLAAYQQRAAAAQQQYQQQKEAGIRAAQEAKERVSQKTTTRVYEKGGAVIRETKGDYQTLQKLKAQQPGSALVQTASGEYVLIKSTGLNLGQESTLAKVNENIQREGGTPYYPTERKLPSGGTLYMGRLADRVTTSEPEPPKEGGPVITQSDFLIDTSRPTKYTAKVGEGSVLVEQGALYQVGLSDTLGPGTPKQYQKTRLLSAREQAELISRGEASPFFIGYKDRPAIAREEQALLEQGVEGQVFPITYTTEEGKEIVTITGASKGAEFKIFSTDKTPPFVPKDTTLIGPAGSNTIISTKKEDYRILPAYGPPTKPESQGPPKKNIVQQAEEKSPLYPLIGEFGKGSKESLKGYIKEGYHLGIEAGLMFVPPEISGIDKPEKREELRQMFEKSYPKELQPKETPLTNLLAGKLPITQYGLKYDIGATATDIFLLGSGIPKIEKLAEVPGLIKKIPSALKEAPEAIKSFLNKDAEIPEAISTRKPPPPPPGGPVVISTKTKPTSLNQVFPTKVTSPPIKIAGEQYATFKSQLNPNEPYVVPVPLGVSTTTITHLPLRGTGKLLSPSEITDIYFAEEHLRPPGKFLPTTIYLGKSEKGYFFSGGKPALSTRESPPEIPPPPVQAIDLAEDIGGGFEKIRKPLGVSEKTFAIEGLAKVKTPDLLYYEIPPPKPVASEKPRPPSFTPTPLSYEKDGFLVTPFPLGVSEKTFAIEGLAKVKTPDLLSYEIPPPKPVASEKPRPPSFTPTPLSYEKDGFLVTPFPLGVSEKTFAIEGLAKVKTPDLLSYEIPPPKPVASEKPRPPSFTPTPL